MSIFVYYCEDCDEYHERIRKIADAGEPAFCEECGDQMELVPAVPSRFVRGKGSWSSPA